MERGDFQVRVGEVLRDELHRVRRGEASRADEFERTHPSRNLKPRDCSKGAVFFM